MMKAPRRASVVVLAIAILALLFIIGSALLFVSSDERENARTALQARELRAIDEALTHKALIGLREDAVGKAPNP